MSLTPITDLKRELATLRELREYDAAIIAKLRLELDAALAALQRLAGEREGLPLSHEITCHGLNFIPNCSEREEQCTCGHAQARAVIAATQGSEQ